MKLHNFTIRLVTTYPFIFHMDTYTQQFMCSYLIYFDNHHSTSNVSENINIYISLIWKNTPEIFFLIINNLPIIMNK